jgi:nucleoside-diphosphate-sugar epimerase
VKEEQNVTEDLPREPLTDYSRFKAMCEDELEKRRSPAFTTLTLRPATVCGWSPRLRLDLSVNILTNHAVNKGKITVFGGAQLRPNFHVRDCAELYVKCLALPAAQIDGKVFNAGYQNLSFDAIAEKVRDIVGPHVEIVHTPTDDNRSYHISSEKILRELGFTPRFTIEDAIRELVEAFGAGKVHDPLTNPLYFNIKRMQEIHLQ